LDCSSPVLVEGHLQLDVWYSREGEKRCKLRVAAERVQFLDKPNPALEKHAAEEKVTADVSHD
jgi:single-strand DNA-binding protein